MDGNVNTTERNSVEMKMDVILQIMQSETFSMTKAAYIVGGEACLKRLIEEGKINVKKPGKKWFCNAADVLRYATIKRYKSNQKSK